MKDILIFLYELDDEYPGRLHYPLYLLQRSYSLILGYLSSFGENEKEITISINGAGSQLETRLIEKMLLNSFGFFYNIHIDKYNPDLIIYINEHSTKIVEKYINGEKVLICFVNPAFSSSDIDLVRSALSKITLNNFMRNNGKY